MSLDETTAGVSTVDANNLPAYPHPRLRLLDLVNRVPGIDTSTREGRAKLGAVAYKIQRLCEFLNHD